MRYVLICVVMAVVIVLDQVTKWLADSAIDPHQYVPVTGFFNLVNVRNRGAAFGFLNDPSITWQIWFFCAAAALAVIVIFWVARGAREKDRPLFAALGCIAGGAVGNVIDRARLGAVVDFLDFHYAGWHWPAFNVADIAICVGAALTALVVLRMPPPGKAEKNSGEKRP